jgi:uncharacterized membrane protein
LISSDGTAVTMTGGDRPSATRHGFIDLLRGFALIFMIETHVVNAYLPEAYRSSQFFYWLSFINGLVAPAFLFAAGSSVILQASRNWDQWLGLSSPFLRQMRRLGFITLVAYYTHIQCFKLSCYLNPEQPDLWRKTLQVDILQCIVASLLVVHLLIVALRKPLLTAWGAGMLAALVALLTPLVWSQDFTGRIPLALALSLNPHGVSLFPLFPWTCFVLSGSVAAFLFLKSMNEGHEIRHIRNVFLLGLFMIACGLIGRWAPITLPGHENFYTTSPLYVMIRLGCLLVIVALLAGLEKLAHLVPKSIQVAGQESLLVYGVHLWLIFAVFRGKHVGPILGLEGGYAKCFMLSAVVTVFMLWLAGRWQRLKRDYPARVKRAQAAAVIIMIIVFVLR